METSAPKSLWGSLHICQNDLPLSTDTLESCAFHGFFFSIQSPHMDSQSYSVINEPSLVHMD